MVLKTFVAKEKDIKREWLLYDASGVILGKLAVEAAKALRGKTKPEYTYNADTGDYVVIINAGQVAMSGKKETDKYYHRHTGYLGNMKSTSYGDLKAKNPEFLITNAVRRMLPKGPLGSRMLKKLKVYRGSVHPHSVHEPRKIEMEVK